MDTWMKLMLTFLTALAVHTCAKFTIKKAFSVFSIKSVAAQVGIVWVYAMLAVVVMIHCTRGQGRNNTNNGSGNVPLF